MMIIIFWEMIIIISIIHWLHIYSPDPRVVPLLIDFLEPKLLAINNDVLLIHQAT
jgi:hypothetical protein